jgi:PIN domain nuclease of toxin-antitoxin system
VRLLLDTHLLLWSAGWPVEDGQRSPLSAEAIALIGDPQNAPIFSVASLWEVAIKSALGRPDFRVDPRTLRRGLIDNGYAELPISGDHAMAVAGLPPLHRDPFDRLLVAQSMVEGILLLTADPVVARYPGPIRRV